MKGKTARRLLPERYRAIFENKMIVCIEYEGLSNDQEREMFQVFFTSRCPYFDFLTHLLESTDGHGADPSRQVHFRPTKDTLDLRSQNDFKLSTGLSPISSGRLVDSWSTTNGSPKLSG